MCRPSNIDVKLGCYSYLLKILILTIAVCELRRGFALQCFHYYRKQFYPIVDVKFLRNYVSVVSMIDVCNVIIIVIIIIFNAIINAFR